MIGESLGAADQPQVEVVFQRPYIGRQLGVVSLRVVNEIPGMDFEETRERHPRRVRQVRPNAALDLRKVRLADRNADLALDRLRKRLLRQLAMEATESAFHGTEETDFFAECHNKSQYPNCNL